MSLLFLTKPKGQSIAPVDKLPDHAQFHSQDSPEWYTPTFIVEPARTCMGSIDLDPASHEEANILIKAKKFYTVEDDGLKQPWFGNVFINPPGADDADGNALVPQFWLKLMEEKDKDPFDQAIWVGYSLQQLQTLQVALPFGAPHPLDFPICYPKARIAFVENAAKKEQRKQKCLKLGKKFNEKSQPSHANYIVGIDVSPDKFKQVFSTIGKVVIPCHG